MKQNCSKRHAVLFLLWFGLSVLLYVGASIWIDQGADQVLFTEETLFGTSSAADGLTVRLHSTYSGQHYWDSEFQMPDYQAAHTDYSYHADGRQLPSESLEPDVNPVSLPSIEELSSMHQMIDCGDYVVAILENPDRLAVLSRNADGTLHLAFDCPLDTNSREPNGISFDHAALAYDGKRLAVAYMKDANIPSFLPRSCKFLVDIFTTDGLLYTGQFSTSLDTVSKSTISFCYGTEAALELSWN